MIPEVFCVSVFRFCPPICLFPQKQGTPLGRRSLFQTGSTLYKLIGKLFPEQLPSLVGFRWEQGKRYRFFVLPICRQDGVISVNPPDGIKNFQIFRLLFPLSFIILLNKRILCKKGLTNRGFPFMIKTIKGSSRRRKPRQPASVQCRRHSQLYEIARLLLYRFCAIKVFLFLHKLDKTRGLYL